MSDSDSDEELDIIKLTINFENIQKEVKVSEDNYSENAFKDECYKLFAIDKDKYELKFYVKDEKAKKSKLETEYISDISDKYEKNNNKLILYLETELKKVKEEKKQDVVEIKVEEVKVVKAQNSSDSEEDDEDKNNENLYSDISNSGNNNNNNKEGESNLYEENKIEEIKDTSNQNKSKHNTNTGISNRGNDSENEKSLNLEETKNKYNKLCNDIDDMNRQNKELEEEINKIKLLIEESKKETSSDDEFDDDEGDEELMRAKYESQKDELNKKIKFLEEEKSKEIQELQKENLKLENNKIKLSKELSNQKEKNQSLKEFNEKIQKDISEFNKDAIENSNLSFNSNDLSLSGANFFSERNEIKIYVGNLEDKKSKKEKKIKKINALYQKMKKIQEKEILRRRDTDEKNIKSEKSLILSRASSKINTIIKINEKKEGNEKIRKENNELKKEIEDLEEQINSVKNEIEQQKKLHEQQVRNITKVEV